ncbi:hypothetical protein FRACYDRAFT_246630 [Fragilariopsis cylindrus CCMP1102]|uniref:Uncharacterized protein n=1 Tax=Fragilariopsis cylindrus CCMP1102 TaxID=635003 RepID=A0A1E7EYY5_9STRA|nr:hypothetical protein FRACYDRAFT_246630 [Fragilariopsis cylindrus CCMP1102]|eukprot:OEU10763.1 hypothetical protein FRACYDRAFT_246630 [Fragilariopsis cylindrus CCMP1102]
MTPSAFLSKWTQSISRFGRDGMTLSKAIYLETSKTTATSTTSTAEIFKSVLLDQARHPINPNTVALSYLRIEKVYGLMKYMGANNGTNTNNNNKDNTNTNTNTNTAKIAFMITSAMKLDLIDRLGYSLDTIKSMKPQQASLVLHHRIEPQLYQEKIIVLENEFEDGQRKQQQYQQQQQQQQLSSSTSSSSSSPSSLADKNNNMNNDTNTNSDNNDSTNTAKIAFMITSAMKRNLIERLGYSLDTIKAMKPQQASLVLHHRIDPQLYQEKIIILEKEFEDEQRKQQQQQCEEQKKERESELSIIDTQTDQTEIAATTTTTTNTNDSENDIPLLMLQSNHDDVSPSQRESERESTDTQADQTEIAVTTTTTTTNTNDSGSDIPLLMLQSNHDDVSRSP